MTSSQKRKGNKGELDVRDLLHKAGYEAVKVPLSGAIKTDDAWKADVKTVIHGMGYGIEVKRNPRPYVEAHQWCKGLFQEYGWLTDADMVFKRSDHKEWLVVLPWETLKQLIEERSNDI